MVRKTLIEDEIGKGDSDHEFWYKKSLSGIKIYSGRIDKTSHNL
jgi:hypothetical protein